MSESSPKPTKGQNAEARMLIIVLLIGVLAAVGFRYHLHSSKPESDPKYFRKKVSKDEMPSMEGNMPSAPPI